MLSGRRTSVMLFLRWTRRLEASTALTRDVGVYAKAFELRYELL